MVFLRKFLAFIVASIFISIVPVMIIVQSLQASFVNEKSLSEKIIPGSYDPLTATVAEYFSKNEEDKVVITKRIQTSISPEIFRTLIKSFTSAFFEPIRKRKIGDAGELKVDFGPLKAQLKLHTPEIMEKLPSCDSSDAAAESFRFCMPKVPRVEMTGQITRQQTGQMFADSIDKQIPSGFTINSNFSRFMTGIVLTEPYAIKSIIIVSAVSILLMALLLFSRQTFFKWTGITFINVAILIGIFAISFANLDRVFTLIKMTPSQSELALLFFKYPLLYLTRWAIGFGIASVLCIIISILVRPKPARLHA